jgi:hypothetical protein
MKTMSGTNCTQKQTTYYRTQGNPQALIAAMRPLVTEPLTKFAFLKLDSILHRCSSSGNTIGTTEARRMKRVPATADSAEIMTKEQKVDEKIRNTSLATSHQMDDETHLRPRSQNVLFMMTAYSPELSQKQVETQTTPQDQQDERHENSATAPIIDRKNEITPDEKSSQLTEEPWRRGTDGQRTGERKDDVAHLLGSRKKQQIFARVKLSIRQGRGHGARATTPSRYNSKRSRQNSEEGLRLENIRTPGPLEGHHAPKQREKKEKLNRFMDFEDDATPIMGLADKRVAPEDWFFWLNIFFVKSIFC